MKKLFTFLLVTGLGLTAYSQSQRMVLIEEGSNASCAPCAAQNPAFKVLLDANLSKAVSIKYQLYFPGFDPMHNHNPTEANGRFDSYYSQNGVPTAMIDGVVPSFGGNPYNGAPAGYSQDLIDTRYAVPAQFDMELTYSLTPESITVNATATCTEATSGNFKMRIAVIEKHIEFATAPGSNVERDFYNVMKKFLPNHNGINMAATYAVGETFTTEQSWTLANVYDINEIAVVAFIQKDDDKSVMQAVMAQDIPVVPIYTNDAVASSVIGVDGFTCEGSINPQVVIQNYGSDALTSLNIAYEINGTTGSMPWTGNLGFFESTTVNLGSISFTPDADNVLNVTTSNPNGATDENSQNNAVNAVVNIAVYSTLGITVEVKTDYYPGETSWEIAEDNGTVVASHQYVAGTADSFGGGGADATKTHTHPVTLDVSKCYTFTLSDSYGDGMSYSGGVSGATPYGYRILNSGGSPIITQQANTFNFGDETLSALRTDEASSIGNVNEFTSFNLYPNPAKDLVRIELSLTKPETVTVEVFDMLGQRVKFEQFNEAGNGISVLPLNVSELSSGIYTVRVGSDSSQSIRNFTVAK
ncbi:MAG: T9SS type A sorting domain-containing protein [Bacteroidia bacterium]